jgi:hypothetical protein
MANVYTEITVADMQKSTKISKTELQILIFLEVIMIKVLILANNGSSYYRDPRWPKYNVAYLSWFLYPIVLLYPFVNIYWSNRQYTYLKYVVWGHLGFTLFMTVIFYGLLGL